MKIIAFLFALFLGSPVLAQTNSGPPSNAGANLLGWTAPSVATNTTSFIVPGGNGANQNFSAFAPRTGTFKNMYFKTANAPGAGQTFIFTLFVNTTATSVTCTISGTTTPGTCSDLADTAAITAGQPWTIQIITSASSAATAQQIIGIELDAQ